MSFRNKDLRILGIDFRNKDLRIIGFRGFSFRNKDLRILGLNYIITVAHLQYALPIVKQPFGYYHLQYIMELSSR